MLIPTSYSLLPNKTACNNGAVLFGAAVSSMCNALNQLNYVKFLGYTNYDVMRSAYSVAHLSNGTDYMNTAIARSDGRITKGYTETHKFFYASTLLSNWIAIVLSYESGTTGLSASSSEFDPVINVELAVLNDSGSGYSQVGIADYGIRFDSSQSLHLASESGSNYSQTFITDTGTIIPTLLPTNTTPDIPRPLYLPETILATYPARGARVVFNVSCSDCKLKTFTTFDLYQSDLS
jgi:hypothetical protein